MQVKSKVCGENPLMIVWGPVFLFEEDSNLLFLAFEQTGNETGEDATAKQGGTWAALCLSFFVIRLLSWALNC